MKHLAIAAVLLAAPVIAGGCCCAPKQGAGARHLDHSAAQRNAPVHGTYRGEFEELALKRDGSFTMRLLDDARRPGGRGYRGTWHRDGQRILLVARYVGIMASTLPSWQFALRLVAGGLTYPGNDTGTPDFEPIR